MVKPFYSDYSILASLAAIDVQEWKISEAKIFLFGNSVAVVRLSGGAYSGGRGGEGFRRIR